MPVLGIGVDVVHLPRIASLIARNGRDRLANRILSQLELHDFQPESPDAAKFLAVRFSVKEAAYKALYPVARPTWKEFTYRSFKRDGHKKPQLLYHPLKNALDFTDWRFHVSVSHDGEYVFSNVLVETKDVIEATNHSSNSKDNTF